MNDPFKQLMDELKIFNEEFGDIDFDLFDDEEIEEEEEDIDNID